ncbi:MAG: hypothetical protein JW929_08540 [Anaerolineales bacterium]|nr:hypothetical protein [Anaerolineales bacterium]
MNKRKGISFCPYAFFKKVGRRAESFFTTPANNPVMLILWLSVSVGIIFIALDILKFPFVTYDRAGYLLCLGDTRHTVGVLAALVCIPLCAAKQRLGYYAALASGAILFLLCSSHAVYMLAAQTHRFEDQIHGPILWALVQIPIVVYAYKSIREAGKNG